MRIHVLAAALSILSASLCAQVDESKFLASAADKLDAQASRCFNSKFHQQAKDLWREVIAFYAPDHEHARKSLGFLRVGTSWAPDPHFTYPDRDEPEPAVARVLGKQFESLAKELGEGHRDLGNALQAAGNAERAKWHFDRAVRFLPADPAAVQASGRKSSGGLFGSEIELTLMRRSRLIDAAVAQQLDKQYDVKPISGEEPPLCGKANVAVHGFETEHFRVWGDWDDDVLRDCAQFAERSFALCQQLFDGIEDYRWPYRQKPQFLLLNKRETWANVIEANRRQFGSDVDFVLKNASATNLDDGNSHVMLGGFEQAATATDYCVRRVASGWANFRCDALNEGIGHAVTGWFFGRNLIFNVAQEKDDGRTSTRDNAAKFQMPDLSVWEELAADIAWQNSDTPAAKLPGITASDFSNEQRIKSWSFCDYVLRRDPKLLKVLDGTGGRRVSESEVTERFAEGSGGLSIQALDAEWRRFWTEDSAILRAIRNKEPALDAVSKRAPEFLDALNKLRKQYEQPEVGWSAEYSAECRQHGLYLDQNKGERGPEKEHEQDPKKKGGGLGGRNFAQTAIVCTNAADPKKTLEEWIALPGYRDAILNPALQVVGLWCEGKTLVMDVTRGQKADSKSGTFYPRGVAPGSSMPSSTSPGLVVDNEVPLADLGAEVTALVTAATRKAPKTVGFPISVHFFRSGAMPQQESVRCTLRLNDKDEVPGVVHFADLGTSRRSAAPGLLVFYPLQPLKRGAAYTVEWHWDKGGMQPQQKFQFFTR